MADNFKSEAVEPKRVRQPTLSLIGNPPSGKSFFRSFIAALTFSAIAKALEAGRCMIGIA
jgi:hypothetical protein